jgi:hypothetical protein
MQRTRLIRAALVAATAFALAAPAATQAAPAVVDPNLGERTVVGG